MGDVVKKHKVVIDRKKWRTGGQGPHKTGEGATRLLNQEGFSCCLGFISMHFLPHENMIGKGVPDLDWEIPSICGDGSPTPVLTQALRINDSETTTQAQKEAELLELFGPTEIELEFIN